MLGRFPFEIPDKYARLPRLMGRATVECTLQFSDNSNIKEGVLIAVVDGYNAPITAGNFVVLPSAPGSNCSSLVSQEPGGPDSRLCTGTSRWWGTKGVYATFVGEGDRF